MIEEIRIVDAEGNWVGLRTGGRLGEVAMNLRNRSIGQKLFSDAYEDRSFGRLVA